MRERRQRGIGEKWITAPGVLEELRLREPRLPRAQIAGEARGIVCRSTAGLIDAAFAGSISSFQRRPLCSS